MYGECDGSCEGQRERDEALRALLSHCRAELQEAHGGAWDAYSDVTDRLAAILDGEQ